MTDNYYQKHKEKLEKEACERYQNLFEAEKKGQYHRIIVNVIRILLKEQKQKLVEYIENNYIAHKK